MVWQELLCKKDSELGTRENQEADWEIQLGVESEKMKKNAKSE